MTYELRSLIEPLLPKRPPTLVEGWWRVSDRQAVCEIPFALQTESQLYHCLQVGELFDEHIAFPSELVAAA